MPVNGLLQLRLPSFSTNFFVQPTQKFRESLRTLTGTLSRWQTLMATNTLAILTETGVRQEPRFLPFATVSTQTATLSSTGWFQTRLAMKVHQERHAVTPMLEFILSLRMRRSLSTNTLRITKANSMSTCHSILTLIKFCSRWVTLESEL